MTAAFLARLALPFALAALSGVASAQTKWDLPTAYPTTNFTVANLVQFADDVDRATAGKLKITVHPNASLFKAPEIKRAVQSGQAQIGDMLPLLFENEWPVYGLDGMPGLATGYAQSMKLYQAQKPAMQARLAEQGMTMLFAAPWPPHGLFSAKPVTSMADMRGAKWRAYSATTARMADLMGATPVTVQAAELSQALATGVVNAFITSAATGVDSKVYEQLKYFYDLQLLIPKTVVIVNTKALQSLDAPTRAALLKASAEAETRVWKESQKQADETMKQLAQRGMTVGAPSPKLAADFSQLGTSLLSDWLGKAGPDGQAIVDAYRKAK